MGLCSAIGVRTFGLVEDGRGGGGGAWGNGQRYAVEKGDIASPQAEIKDCRDDVVGERFDGGCGGEGDLFCRQREQRSQLACWDIFCCGGRVAQRKNNDWG